MKQLTIVIPNRNRNLLTVEKSISSIYEQLNEQVNLVIIDYGSKEEYQKELQEFISRYKNIELILCPTQGQLWNKSRCINMVLKTCETSHFMVSDMDMIWHPQFLKNQFLNLKNQESIYYTVGVMTQEESALKKTFEEYSIKFQTDNEATGITIFPTEQLKSINGFDEFYHGWGSEDTDVHMRLKNAGYEVRFRESEIYFKHQWHEKGYRNKESKSPFHENLERINHTYFTLNKDNKKKKANSSQEWGESCDSIAYKTLEKPSQTINLYATEDDVKACVHYLNGIDLKQVIQVNVTNHPQLNSLKTIIKKISGRKTPRFISLKRVNEILLEFIIMNYHNYPYYYSYDRQNETILLTINLEKPNLYR